MHKKIHTRLNLFDTTLHAIREQSKFSHIYLHFDLNER
jgi:hypothetical protein